MGPVTYYLFFSIIAVLMTGLYVANASYYRLKGKTMVGEKYEPGTPSYKALEKNTSTPKIVTGSVLFPLFVINLIYIVHRIIAKYDSSYSLTVLIYAPLFMLLITFIVGFKAYNNFNKKNK